MNKKYIVAGIIGLAAVVTAYCFMSGRCGLLTPDQKGYRNFEAGNYEDAALLFKDPMWRGSALYRAGKFKEAAGVFSGFDTAQAAFNHGNSLVMLGKYEDAVKQYQHALQLQPGWNEAQTNLEIARGRAEKLKREGGEMTGGMLGADEIVFSDKPADQNSKEQDVVEGQKMSDKELRTMWLRNVQTKPADFLRAKFSYQVASQQNGDDVQAADQGISPK